MNLEDAYKIMKPYHEVYKEENERKSSEFKQKFKIRLSKEFSKLYPDLSFEDLQEPSENIIMIMGTCIYFKHRKTGVIYSRNDFTKEWKVEDSDKFNNLFDNST